MAVIFLVEDDAELRLKLKELLVRSGYEVWDFTNGKDVLEMYQRRLP